MPQLEYHKNMRRFLLILMLLLLPLRGLMGDAMAYSMLPPALHEAPVNSENTTKSIANYLIPTSEKIEKSDLNNADDIVQSPCHSAEASGDSTNNSTSTESSQCTTCQVCHLTTFLPLSSISGLAHTVVDLPSQAIALWHSAEPRRIAKTPVV